MAIGDVFGCLQIIFTSSNSSLTCDIPLRDDVLRSLCFLCNYKKPNPPNLFPSTYTNEQAPPQSTKSTIQEQFHSKPSFSQQHGDHQVSVRVQYNVTSRSTDCSHRQYANQAAETIQGAGSEASKEANKSEPMLLLTVHHH